MVVVEEIQGVHRLLDTRVESGLLVRMWIAGYGREKLEIANVHVYMTKKITMMRVIDEKERKGPSAAQLMI